MNLFRPAWAFVRAGALEALSYRASILLNLSSTVLEVAMLNFLGRMLDAVHIPVLDRYGGSYFAFAATGSMIGVYMGLSLRGFAGQIRQGQLTGTLEAIFLLPLATWQVPALMQLWSFVAETLRFLLYLLVALAFGLRLDSANWLTIGIVLFATVLSLAPLGILSAAFVLRFQKGDPIAYVVSAATTLLGGVLYPIEVLPGSLQVLAGFLPLTHAVAAFRSAVLGSSVGDVAVQLGYLAAFALTLGPAALLLFQLATQQAKRRGLLSQY